MRKFFSFRSSSSGGNDNFAPSEPNKSRKKISSGVTEGIKDETSTQESICNVFKTPKGCVLKPLNQNLKDERSSNPHLRRSLSLTSEAICSHLKEGSFSSSSDQSRTISHCNNDQHVGRYPLRSDGSLTPDRYGAVERENLWLNAIEKQSSASSFGVRQNSSDSTSACSSPIPLRCRTARSSRISSHNKVLDLYIDGEHKITKGKDDSRKCVSETGGDGTVVENNKISILGRPPRALCTTPTSPHHYNHRSYSFREIKDKHYELPSREWISDDVKPAFQQKNLENNSERTSALLGKSFSDHQECDARINAPIEDIYENSSDGNHSTSQGCSLDLIPINGTFNGNWFYDLHRKVCLSSRGSKTSWNDELINSKLQEHAINEDLLKKLKELEENYSFFTEEDPESERFGHESLNKAALLENIMKLKENGKHLTAELFSQLRSRLAERSFANELLKQSKLELNTRTRRLENEKNELQLSLENELDRRSNEWSLKQSKFQAEEQRLRERVKELAEKNVSLQRIISSFQDTELETRNNVMNIERQLNESRASQDELEAESLNLHQALLELQERCNGAEEQRDHLKRSFKEVERENMELQKLVGRLQRSCSEQDKTITGLRQSCSRELEKLFLEGDTDVVQLQTEKIRLTGVEQKLRRELESCRIETESLQNENIRLLNCLQGTESRYNLSLVRLNVELHAWLECLKMKSLPLLDDSSHFCSQLLDLIACKRFENCENANSDSDSFCAVDLTFKYQDLTRAIGSFRRSLKTVSTTLEEKESIQASQCICKNTEIEPSKQQEGHRSENDMEVELKAETILTKLLREKIYSRELEIEQLHRDLASSVRKCDLLNSDIQRLMDEVSCLKHKKRDMEIQMSKKDENFLLLQQDLQACTKELAATRNMVTNLSEERDHIWEEMKQLREKNMIMDCELKSLQKKIELLDEDILYKEGQISILKDSLGNKAFDIICSPVKRRI